MSFINDKAEYNNDHVKVAFAALPMLRNILQKYFYSKETTSQDLKLHFVHARVHLWSMERIALSKVPTKVSTAAEDLSLGNFFWRLKGHLGNYGDNKMKQEHGDYMLSLQLGQSIEKRKSLFSLIDKDIKKPKRGS
ncbi:hypothetical protein AB4K20DRAFT_1994273, partial [Rhizopus microsporus]